MKCFFPFWTDDENIKLEKVRLRIEPRLVAKFEVASFHPSQTVSLLPDGPAEVSCQVIGAEEMLPWLMTWGSTVEIIDPEWLRKKLVANAHR